MFRVRNIPADGLASSDAEQKNARIIRMGTGTGTGKIALLFAFPAIVFACGLDGNLVISAVPADGDGDGGTGDASTGGDAGSGGDSSGGDSGSTGDSGSPATPVYAISSSALYRLDATTSVLKNLGGLTSCNDFAIDIAMSPTNQLYAITQNGSNRDLAVLSMAGTCSQQEQLDSTHTLSIGYSGTSPPNLLELRDDTNDLELIDPTNGTDTTFQGNALPGNANTDIACGAGKCWYTVDHSHCNPDPGPGGVCLFSMNPDGTGGAQYRPISSDGLGGLAYYGQALYLFSKTTSAIHRIDLTNAGAAIVDLSTTGDPRPSSWVGAASSSSYP